MRLKSIALAAAVLVGGIATVSAAPITPSAAPLNGATQTGGLTQGGLIQKIHGWHYRCAWGPVRYHRHIEGIGNVPCQEYRRPRYRYYERYRPRRPRVNCEARFYVCKDDWGSSKSSGFFRCMRRVGCQ